MTELRSWIKLISVSSLLAVLGCSDSIAENNAESDPFSDTEIGASGTINGNYYCRPDTEGNGQLLIHLVGTFADPTTERSFEFALHACTHGFAAIVPSYNNATAARRACGDDDPCHEAFHREILYGEEVAPDPINVGPGESIVDRVSSLLERLSQNDTDFDWAALSTTFDSRDFEKITVSGHSQGNGHALYWARESRMRRTILLGGIAERLGPSSNDSDRVTWLKEMAVQSATPSERIKSFLHVDEDALTGIEGSRANLDLIGVAPQCDFFSLNHDCSAIEIPSMGCRNPVAAHGTVIVESFDENCGLGGVHSNNEAWDILLF